MTAGCARWELSWSLDKCGTFVSFATFCTSSAAWPSTPLTIKMKMPTHLSIMVVNMTRLQVASYSRTAIPAFKLSLRLFTSAQTWRWVELCLMVFANWNVLDNYVFRLSRRLDSFLFLHLTNDSYGSSQKNLTINLILATWDRDHANRPAADTHNYTCRYGACLLRQPSHRSTYNGRIRCNRTKASVSKVTCYSSWRTYPKVSVHGKILI